MTDKPILMGAPMVLAILREVACPGTGKTMTRRIPKAPISAKLEQAGAGILSRFPRQRGTGWEIGDVLWVREAWAPLSALTHNDPGAAALATNGLYRADDSVTGGEIKRWRPSIHMPRWASRLTLTVTDVKIERLQDISEADALAEGVPHIIEGNLGDEIYCRRCDGMGTHAALGYNLGMKEVDCEECKTTVQRFENLWKHINGPKAWEANPWVAAVSFRPELHNIDAPARPSLAPQSPLLLREAGER